MSDSHHDKFCTTESPGTYVRVWLWPIFPAANLCFVALKSPHYSLADTERGIGPCHYPHWHLGNQRHPKFLSWRFCRGDRVTLRIWCSTSGEYGHLTTRGVVKRFSALTKQPRNGNCWTDPLAGLYHALRSDYVAELNNLRLWKEASYRAIYLWAMTQVKSGNYLNEG